MRLTKEQREYTDVLRGQVDGAGLRVRVVPDGEGFPIIPGRLGQVEFYGAEHATGERRLRVFTNRRVIRGRLRALPGLVPQQIGDDEARFWFPADAPEVLRAVCGIIRARRRRQGSAQQAAHLARNRAIARAESESRALGSILTGEPEDSPAPAA